jgi:hypothetical protein
VSDDRRARRVLGLDLSITGTGAVHSSAALGLGLGAACVHTFSPSDKFKDRRLGVIKAGVLKLIRGGAPGDTDSLPEFALIEDLPFNAKAAGVTGMVHGIVRDMLHEREVPYGLVPASTLKKYATGKGAHPGLGKTPMAIAALKRAGAEFADDNQCDAWWLWVMAHDHLGSPLFDLPALHRESLSKIKLEV